MKSSFWMKIFFLILAGLLAGLAVFQGRQKKEDEKSAKIQALVFKEEIKKEDVSSIEIQRRDGESLSLKKNQNKWQIEHPLKDHADQQKIQSFLDDLLSQEVVQLDENVHWAEYDLVSPVSELTLKAGDQTWKVAMSGTPNFEDRYFLRKEDHLLLGSSKWRGLLRLWPDNYRSRRLYHFQTRPYALQFQTQNKNYKFVYKDYLWKWDQEKELFPLSQEAFEEFWTSLRQDMIKNFTDQKKSDVEKTWQKPDLILKWLISKDDLNKTKDSSSREYFEWAVQMNKTQKGQFHLIVSDRDYVYETDDVTAEKLLTADFRDHKAPFKWNLRELAYVEIKMSGLDFSMKKTAEDSASSEKSANSKENKWEVLHPEGYELDLEKWDLVLDWMNDLEAEEYIQKPIQNPKGHFIFKDSRQAVLLRMDFGGIFKDQDREMIHVRTSHSKETLAVDYENLQQALVSSLIQKLSDQNKEPSKTAE